MPSSYEDNAWFIFGRICIGEIIAVQPESGKATVRILDSIGVERPDLELAMGGFTKDGHDSGWIRYMPKEHDLVLVGFGIQNQAMILGPASYPGNYGSYAGLKKSDHGKAQIPAGDFRSLARGEWDLRSSGGAYVHGTNAGDLLLSAGPLTVIRADKRNNEVRTQAKLSTWTSLHPELSVPPLVVNAEMRFGDFKRLVPGTFSETNFGVPTKEFYVSLPRVASHKLGILRDDLTGLPIPSTLNPAATVNSHTTVSDLAGVPVYDQRIDSAGNVSTFTGPDATTVATTGLGATSYSLTFTNFSVNSAALISLAAGTSLTASAPTISLTAAALQLGSPLATQQVVLGTAFIAQLNLTAIQLAVSLASLGAGLGAAAAISADLTIPLGAAAAAAEAAALVAQQLASLTTPASPFLSLKVFTE